MLPKLATFFPSFFLFLFFDDKGEDGFLGNGGSGGGVEEEELWRTITLGTVEFLAAERKDKVVKGKKKDDGVSMCGDCAYWKLENLWALAVNKLFFMSLYGDDGENEFHALFTESRWEIMIKMRFFVVLRMLVTNSQIDRKKLDGKKEKQRRIKKTGEDADEEIKLIDMEAFKIKRT